MLTVTDSADNSVTETKTGYITVVAPPDADFSGDPRAVLIGQSVSFTDLSGGGVGSLTWEWDFGDGGTSSSQNPSHGYGAAGTYTVTLTVTDSATNSDTETKIGYITVVAGPHADFTADDTVAMAGQNIDFTNLSSGGIAPFSYQWDFDNDGSWDGTAEHETHAYSSPGTYTVVLRITDAAANADSETKVDYITIVRAVTAPLRLRARGQSRSAPPRECWRTWPECPRARCLRRASRTSSSATGSSPSTSPVWPRVRASPWSSPCRHPSRRTRSTGSSVPRRPIPPAGGIRSLWAATMATTSSPSP